jgi:(p)ppGpp synthase/HD superfamily hydrolase
MIKERIHKAYEFAKAKHAGQKRKNSNLDYFTHPKYVARIVEQIISNEKLVSVALLHDVLEDTDTTYDELVDIFGEEIAGLVYELTNKTEERNGRKKKDYILDKMAKMSNEALLVKLADRLHNVLFLGKDGHDADDFIIYYYTNTDFILKKLKSARFSQGLEFTEEHKVLIKQIENVLDFLKARYNL